MWGTFIIKGLWEISEYIFVRLLVITSVCHFLNYQNNRQIIFCCLSLFRGSVVFKTLRSSHASLAREVSLTSEEYEKLEVHFSLFVSYRLDFMCFDFVLSNEIYWFCTSFCETCSRTSFWYFHIFGLRIVIQQVDSQGAIYKKTLITIYNSTGISLKKEIQ